MLLSITLCWSSAYIFIKDLPPNLSAFAYLAITTGIAGIIMLAIFHKSLLQLNLPTLGRSIVLAVLIAGTMLLEKLGLSYLPSSTASFFFSLTIILVPIILMFFRKFPSRNNILGILIILIGLFVSTGSIQTGNSLLGILYICGACALMSLYTVFSADFTKKSNPLLLSVLQICFSAIIGFILWFWEDPATFSNITWSKQMLSSIFILAFFSKAYAYIMLMYAQKYANAISVTIISAVEPVVTLALALLIPNMQGETESFSIRALGGAIIIVIGAIVSDLNFLSSKKKKALDESAAATSEHQEAPALPAGVSPLKKKHQSVYQFFITMIPFAVLGATFKVMVLVEGLTEVRPANAIPVVAGLLFGPAGALGCAVGNLIADCFGTLNLTSILGVVGNFMAAYIPYRAWYAISRKEPHMHTWKNLSIFLWVACLGTLACAWILGLGLELFFGIWIDTVYKYVLLNNIGFSIVLGLPILILLTSNSVNIPIHTPKPGKHAIYINRKTMIGILIAETIVLLLVMIGIYLGYHLSNSIAMWILSGIAAVLMICICIFKGRDEQSHESF